MKALALLRTTVSELFILWRFLTESWRRFLYLGVISFSMFLTTPPKTSASVIALVLPFDELSGAPVIAELALVGSCVSSGNFKASITVLSLLWRSVSRNILKKLSPAGDFPLLYILATKIN